MMPTGVLTAPLPATPRRAIVAIEAAVGLNALGGMAYALAGADAVPSEWLERTPFHSYRVPGLYLGLVVGGTSLAAAAAAARNSRHARAVALASSGVTVSWIAPQVAMIGYRSPLQPIVAGAGVAVACLAVPR